MRRKRGPEDSFSQCVQGKEDRSTPSASVGMEKRTRASINQCVQGKEDRRIPLVCAGKRGPEHPSVCAGNVARRTQAVRAMGCWPRNRLAPGVPGALILARHLVRDTLLFLPGPLPGIDNISRTQLHHLFKPHGKYVSGAAVTWGARQESKEFRTARPCVAASRSPFPSACRTCSLLDPPYLATHSSPATRACPHFPSVLIAHATSAFPCIPPGTACEPL